MTETKLKRMSIMPSRYIVSPRYKGCLTKRYGPPETTSRTAGRIANERLRYAREQMDKATPGAAINAPYGIEYVAGNRSTELRIKMGLKKERKGTSTSLVNVGIMAGFRTRKE